MSSASGDGAARAPALRDQAVVLVRPAAALVIAGGFVFMAVKTYGQIERLLWRPVEVWRMASAAASLATTFPVRFAVLVLGSVAVMLAAEYRPRAVLRVSTAVWISLGVAGTGAYLLSAFDAGSRWAFAVLVGAGVVAAGVILVRRSSTKPMEAGPARGPDGPSWSRPLLPIAVGLVGGLLAVRASIEPVTEWDAVIYHVSFARDWIDSLPGLPHAAGPSVGAELSYNYPALFPSVSVVLAGALHVGVGTVAKLVSPLAAITVLAVLRAVGSSAVFAGWAAPMFLLGSTLFVAYGAWPTAYMLMIVLLVLVVARLLVERRLTAATALCIGLLAATGLIGVVFALVVLVVCFTVGLGRRTLGRAGTRVGSLPRAAWAVAAAVLLAAPLGAVVVGSVRRTGGLLFPWLTWPNAAHLLPPLYWNATRHEILANSYGQFDASVGSIRKALVGIAESGLLAPGGLALQGLIVIACALAYARHRRALLAGTAAVAGAALIFVLLELVWLRYFVPMSVAAAVGLGVAVGALRARSGRVELVAYTAAVVAACLSLVSGLAYALAGPNDRTYTATTNYRLERYSAFESAKQAADTRSRRDLVYGDDSRAWDDTNLLDAGGVSVGTFDVRNYYSPYRPGLQLDGLAGAAIDGNTGSAVARQLASHGIHAVFVPSWFWEPGGARHPLADKSPVALWVGAPALRALRVYLPDSNVTYPSVLYLVGSTPSARRRVATLLGSPAFSVEGALSTRRRILRDGFALSGPLGGSLHWRVAAPVTESGGPSIRLTSKDVAAVRGVVVYEPRDPTLVNPAMFVDCTRVAPFARQSILDVAFPGSALGFDYLDVGSGNATRDVKAVIRGLPVSDRVLVRACGDPTGSRGGIFPGRSTATRIIMEHRGSRPVALSFDYLDAGRRTVSFNLFDEARNRWIYDVAHLVRCGSGRWLHAQLPMDELPRGVANTGTIELGPVVSRDDFAVRNLRVLEGRTTHRQGAEPGRHGPPAGCGTAPGSAARG